MTWKFWAISLRKKTNTGHTSSAVSVKALCVNLYVVVAFLFATEKYSVKIQALEGSQNGKSCDMPFCFTHGTMASLAPIRSFSLCFGCLLTLCSVFTALNWKLNHSLYHFGMNCCRNITEKYIHCISESSQFITMFSIFGVRLCLCSNFYAHFLWCYWYICVSCSVHSFSLLFIGFFYFSLCFCLCLLLFIQCVLLSGQHQYQLPVNKNHFNHKVYDFCILP